MNHPVIKPQAIKELVGGIKSGKKRQVLILAHNKTLAGQLYSEFKELLPENHVEYFVSYYGNTVFPVLPSVV